MKATPVYWYGDKRGLRFYLLIPVSWAVCLLVWLRRSLYRAGIPGCYRAPVPVIVVGNITAGGSGKTPLVIWLARFLKERGFHPGIVSRGYGGQAKVWPQQVRADSDYVAVGDEAVMIAARTECPMAVGPDRSQVVRTLLQHYEIDVVLSDDGLQHYALGRDIEIAVVNGERRFGNGYCLPAGPLREKPSRLDEVDIIVVNGEGERREHPMSVNNQFAINMQTSETKSLQEFTDGRVHAVAGVGHPQRFFDGLRASGLQIETHEYPDHYQYKESDIDYGDHLPVLMTEKDAVKCMRFNNSRLWCVPASVEMGNAFGQRVLMLLGKVESA
jgi:tetraacyldisaccharide 4'-kinase